MAATVRPPDRARHTTDGPQGGRIVVGVDGSAGSAAALRWAAAEACCRQAVLRIVSAWQEPHPGQRRPGHPADPAGAAAARVQKALARVLAQQPHPRQVSCRAVQGGTAAVLLAEAAGADLLVLGIKAAAPQAPGPAGWCWLRHARVPVVFVPS